MLFLHQVVRLNIFAIFSHLKLIFEGFRLPFRLDLLNQILARILNVVSSLHVLSLHAIYERLCILVHVLFDFVVVLAVPFIFGHRKIGLLILLVLVPNLLLTSHTFNHSLHVVIVILHERSQVGGQLDNGLLL